MGVPRHGMCGTKTYRAWSAMRQRCSNPNEAFYHRYGGRGIKVCERWDSFEAFYEDVGEIPEGMQLDRKDNEGDYSPENIRLVPNKENSWNTKKSKIWHVAGVDYPSRRAAAAALGVSASTIVNWCEGRYRGGRYQPPKSGCHSRRLYET